MKERFLPRLQEISHHSTKHHHTVQFSSVQLLSRVQLFVTLWTAACQASLSITTSQSLLKFMSIESVMPSSHLILCRPLLLLPLIFPSIRIFSNESNEPLHQVAKGLEIHLQHRSLQCIFRTDFLQDGLVGSPCSPRNSQESSPNHSSKASILQCSAFFIVQCRVRHD